MQAIHQFTPNMAFGDSISNALIYTQKLLQDLGFESSIYVGKDNIDYHLNHNIFHISEYKESKEQILFYHHSVGHNNHDNIMKFKDEKILIYHNITPSHFFRHNLLAQKMCDLGRIQLENASKYFISSFADSKYNAKELKYYNYSKAKVLTLLLDLDKQEKNKANEILVEKYSQVYNIIFVGRVVSNKAQHQLVDVMFALKNKGIKNFKLHIIGGTSQGDYMDFLKSYIKNLEMLVEVTVVGKVSDEDLAAYYKLADLYISLSEHEGFGMPLVEAMKHDIPVLAFNAGGISTTVPKECLLENKAPSFIAEKIIQLQNNPYFRVALIKKQKEQLKKFSYKNSINNLSSYLIDLGIQTNYMPTKDIENQNTIVNYQIEGPFDSSYSLAIVNKDIALALDASKCLNVKLYSTEGDGDFQPQFDILNNHIKKLSKKSLRDIDITIRNLYPPRTNAMQGYHKIIGPYGWEESKFPQEYVEWFNTKLTLIFTMSKYVENLLQNNGVTVPIITTGIVADNILKIESSSFKFDLPLGYKLLHISSAFPRKGINILLEAFDAIAEKKKISLILKTFINPHNKVLLELENLGFSLKVEYEENIFLYTKNKKEILLINKDITQSQIKYLYENSDLLISPSYGEGFGLPMAEAMLLELPVITTAFGGQSDFCTNETSWLIDFDFRYAVTHINLINSLWQKPRKKHLQELIEKLLLLSQDEIKIKTKRAKKFILENYSSKNISLKIQDAIKNYPRNKVKQKIALMSTYNTKCGIADYAKYLISTFEKDVVVFAPKTTQKLLKEDNLNVFRSWIYGRKNTNIEELKQSILDQEVTQFIIQYNFGFFSLEVLQELIEFCNVHTISIHLFLHSTKNIVLSNETISFLQIKQAMQKATNIYVHSIYDKNYLKQMGIFENTHLFTHGLDSKLIKDIDAVEEEEMTLATFGYLLPQKGILELIDILMLLHEKGVKAKLLLLTALYPSTQSKQLEKAVKEKIDKSNIKQFITLDTRYLPVEQIVSKLSKSTKIVYYYGYTQESSSAAVRMGLLAQKEVITSSNEIFDNIKNILTQPPVNTLESMVDTIIKSLKTPYNVKKHKLFLEQNSWDEVSRNFNKVLV